MFKHITTFWNKGYLYILFACIIHLTWFLSNNVGVLDWIKEIAYFEYFKTSFNDYHTLPYFWWNILEEVAWRPPIPGTSALVANPETALFSPLMPLLYFFKVETFIKLYVITQFVIGVFGLLLLKKKLEWNNTQFRIFTVLFLFSPIIMQHIAVAYFTWYNFYLFPWLILFIAEKDNIKSIVGISAVFGLIVLQGGIYIVQYLGLFYVLYEVLHIIFEKEWKRIPRLIFIPIFAVFLSWARLSTTAFVYGDYLRPWVEIDGYNLPFFLFYALIPTITIPPIDLFFHSDFLGWSLTPHDSGLFWGLSLIMIVVVITRYSSVVKNASSQNQKGMNYNAVFISATFLLLISFYKIWYLLMSAISAFELPLFESIKNHGIRFIMGAFFAYALLLANYSNEIWKELKKFIETRFWTIIKKVFLKLIKLLVVALGLMIVGLKIFSDAVSGKAYEIITNAYNGTASKWLESHMEGLHLNSLEFYYKRFGMVYQSTLKWMIVSFVILSTMFLISCLIKRNKNRFNLFLLEFPHFKFEMLLAIPLIVSMSMWANLASSVPFSSIQTLPFSPPAIEAIVVQDIETTAFTLTATPKYLRIESVDTENIKGYYLQQIPASDSVWFDVLSNNIKMSDRNTKLLLIPTNNNDIELQFKTHKIQQSIVITIVAWSLVLIFSVFNIISKRKQD